MFKRPLALTAVLFSLGVLIAALNFDLEVAIVLLAILCTFIYFKTGKTFICVLTLAVIFSGIARMNLAQLYRENIVSEYAETTAMRELTVTEFSEENRVIASFKDKNHTYKVYLTVKGGGELFPGDIIEGEVTLRAPLASKTQFSGFSDYLAGRGVYLTAYTDKVSHKGRQADSIMAKIYSLRVFMDKLGERCFSGNTRALFNAMVFGDKRLISDELSSYLQASGLNHIAVVSGMHLSVMIAMVMFFVNKIFGKRRIGYIFAVLAAIFITLATGAGASVMRALIMCSMFFLSQLLYRESDPLTSLSFAALLMIIINPFIIFNAGFVLSVLSVLGILLYNRKISGFLEKYIPPYVAQSASLSISAQLMVTPALIYYFGIITPYFLISNLLLVTLSGVYVIVGIILILFSWAGPISLLLEYLVKLMSLVIESVCYCISSLPGATANITTPYAVFFLAWICVLILIYIYPADIKKLFKIAAASTVAILSIIIFSNDNTMNIQVYPYGGQTLSFVELSSGDSILIDCPDIYDAQQLGHSLLPLKYAVMSADGYGQLFDNESTVEKVIAPKTLFTDETKEELIKKAGEKGSRIVFLEDFQKARAGDVLVWYIPIEGIDSDRAIKLEYDGKTLITLQGLNAADILKLYEEKVCFYCDYLVLPFTAFPEGTDIGRLCTGDIVNHTK